MTFNKYVVGAVLAVVGSFNLGGAVAKAQSVDDFIVGGVSVTASDPIAATTVALLLELNDGEALCSGSILSGDLVLTAGHCVYDEKTNQPVEPKQITIIFGTNAHRSKETRPVVKFVVPTTYKGPSSENAPGALDVSDIALVRFTGGLPDGYQPAAMLTDSSLITDGASVVLAGYGITSGLTQKGAGVLRKTDVTIAAMGKTEVAFDQANGHGSCNGDSGGPAFIEQNGTYYLFGVTSRGDEDCLHEGIYTNALAYSDWLVSAKAALETAL